MSTAMLDSSAKVIAYMLIDLGLGTLPAADPANNSAWPTYYSSEPTDPDNCLTVYDTDDVADARLMETGEQCFHYGFQVRVRATDHDTGWTKVQAAEKFLEEQVYMRRVTVGSNSYRVWAVTRASILKLGRNVPGTKRTVFTLNALAVISPLY